MAHEWDGFIPDKIISAPASKAYQDGYDRIFGKDACRESGSFRVNAEGKIEKFKKEPVAQAPSTRVGMIARNARVKASAGAKGTDYRFPRSRVKTTATMTKSMLGRDG